MTADQLSLCFDPVKGERWLQVPGHEGLYEVSDHGRVKSLRRMTVQPNGGVFDRKERILRPGKWHGGHLFVILSKDGERKRWGVHQLVLTAFVGPCPPGQECLHEDDVPDHNHLGNLRWGTRAENWSDAVYNGSRIAGQRGVRNVRAKLTESQVRQIRASLLMNVELAVIYGVAPNTISVVRSKGSYRDV